ncbi:MAG: hypothetical protein Q7J54_02420 [Candidatus Woesearchaeota archaeon]|nr:hypothetical protein [Candidatus Woesearchaeota archaeon]
MKGKNEDKDDVVAVMGLLLAGTLIGFLVYGAVNGNVMKNLDINDDKFIKSYVIEHYPEYIGCDMDYDAATSTMEVYCNDKRDGLETINEPIKIKLKKPVFDLFKEEVKKCFAGRGG